MAKANYDFTNPRALDDARVALLKVAEFLEVNGVSYFLEAGTLLGIVRDKDLIPWDHDIDLCITSEWSGKLLKLRWLFLRKGFKFTIRKNPFPYGPVNNGDIRMIKIKPIWPYIKRMFTGGSKANFPVVDVFVKYSDGENVFWQVEGLILKINKDYYSAFEYIEFFGKHLRAPLRYKDYLTEKYRNWEVPVKDWRLKTGDFTIVEEHK